MSPDGLWREVSLSSIELSLAEVKDLNQPEAFRKMGSDRAYVLNVQKLDTMLDGAPGLSSLSSITKGGREIVLPLPNGTFERFSVFESSVLPPELAEKVRGTRMYAGVGIDRPELRASVERTLDGWSAMILSPDGTSFVTPALRERNDLYLSLEKAGARQPFLCVVKGSAPRSERDGAERRLPTTFGGTTRTYRLAIGATAEYVAFFRQPGDTDAQAKRRAFDEITRGVARVSQVYNRDAGIQFALVAKELDLIFTDTKSDGYSSGNGLVLLDENQAKLDGVLTNAGYDVGHVVDVGSIGYGKPHSVCTAGTKGRGETGISRPTGDAFWIDYVAHEIGHQFGANHSFNGTSGYCGASRAQAAAYEPGSGSTIMGYAALCAPQNVAIQSDDYFHAISLDELLAHATGGGGCATSMNNGNRAPTIAFAGSASVLIPKGTPFELNVTGSDPDGDPLRYSFEQYDTPGDPSPEDNDFDGRRRPMFRSVIGTTPSRAFPSIANIAGAVPATTSFESSPQTSNALTVRAMARDPRGGFAFADATVSVVQASGPFKINSPGAATSWKSGETQTIAWDVANTRIVPLSCAIVKIALSTDGGATFATLIASTANDGSENITVPGVASAGDAVVRIDCLNQVFFAATPRFAIVP